MATLEDLQAGAFIGGLAPGEVSKVVHIEWFVDQAVKLTYDAPWTLPANEAVWVTGVPLRQALHADSGSTLNAD